MEGSLKMLVSLRSGDSFVTDAITFDEMRDVANQAELDNDITISDDEIQERLTAQVYELAGMIKKIKHLEYLSVIIDGDPRVIHPDDIAYIQFNTTGIFRDIITEAV